MNKLVLFGLLLGLLLGPVASTTVITSAAVGDSQTLEGSLYGGTKITFTGTGFGADATAIQIYVGTYKCTIEDGLTDTKISCFTAPLTNFYDQTFPIRIRSNGENVDFSATFAYKSSQTPHLVDVNPSASIAGDSLDFFGQHKINHDAENAQTQQDVVAFKVGNEICDILEIAQDISANSWVDFQCRSSPLSEGGRYQVSQHVLPGYAKKSPTLEKAKWTDDADTWDHVVLPAVNRVLPNSGLPEGQDIVIEGSGFSYDTAKINVDVDGVPCSINQANVEKISCTLGARSDFSTKKIPTDSSDPQVNGYIGGTGFKYEKYNIAGLGTQTHLGLRTALKDATGEATLESESVIGQMEIPNESGTYGKVLKGYFYAPVSGEYIFRGAADDSFGFYISSQYGTASVGDTPYIYAGSHTSQKDDYHTSNQTTALGAPLTLSQGKYYFVEIYMVNNAGPGYLKISVEVPNTITTLPFQRYEVNEIQLSMNNIPQIKKFTLEVGEGAAGTFQLSLRRYEDGQLAPVYQKVEEFSFSASQSQFKSKLDNFDIYRNKQISVTREVFDANGDLVTSGDGVKYEWTVTIPIARNDVQLAQSLTFSGSKITPSATFNEETIQAHGPLLQGTFNLQIDASSVLLKDTSGSYTNADIPYNVGLADLRNAIRQLPGFEGTIVTRKGSCAYGCTYILEYEGLAADVPDLVLSGAGLTGDTVGITFAQFMKYSSNVIVRPADDRFLFLAVDRPQVVVTVNDIPSTCTDACSYDFITTVPQITAQSLSTNTLSLTISDPNSDNYDLSVIKIKLGGQTCSNLAGSFTSLTCDLPTNADGTVTLEAGDHNAEVWISQVGKIQLQGSVTPITVTFSITSVTPAQGGQNGGVVIDIAGTGFPLTVDQASIDLCGATVKPSSTNNIVTSIVAPVCSVGVQTLTYTFGSYSDTINFQYVAASTSIDITSISPQSWSPVEKGEMVIQGNNFPTDPTQITVHLAKATGNVYQMRVLSATATEIKCGIPGGLAGTYDVVVGVQGSGNAVPTSPTVDDFTYQLEITSISPTTGSHFGGTQITIQGKNFSPHKADSMISVGEEMNTLCAIETITETQIVCRTPSSHPDWTSTTQNLIVSSKLIADSTCSSTCSFTYKDQASSMKITSLSTASTLSATGSITVTGTNFDLTNLADLRITLTNTRTYEETVVTPTTPLATSIAFDVPDVEAGDYVVRVRLDPEGQSNGWALQIRSKFIQATYDFSENGGPIIIQGKGLPKQWPNKQWGISMKVGDKVQKVNVLSTSPAQLSLEMPPSQVGTTYDLKIEDPTEKSITTVLTSSAAPAISVTTSSPVSGGSNTIQFSIDSLTELEPTKLFSYNVLNHKQDSEVSLTRTADTFSASIDFKAGKHKFKVLYEGLGWATVTGEIDVSAAATYTAANVDSSFAGGQFTVTGTDINPEAVIKIGGFEGKVLSQTASQTVFEIPPMITSDVIGWYPVLKKSQLIEPAAIVNDGGQLPKEAFDKELHTQYSSANTVCYIGIDVGENKVVNPQRIRYFPSPGWAVVGNYLRGATIKASVDNVSFDVLHTVDTSVHAGWNSFLIDGATNYRYFRLQHDQTDTTKPVSSCKIAEFEVHGLLFSDITATDGMQVDVIFTDGLNEETFTQAVTYSKSATPEITDIDQQYGHVFGGYSITLTGLNLGALDINIDNVPCAVSASTATSVTCQVGQRLSLPAVNKFDVSLNGNKAVLNKQFLYVLRWSDVRTWGTDLPPVQNDLVYVPAGMSLFVDQSTPKLEAIIVTDGKLIFSDEKDLQIHTGLILINQGEFRAGTKQKPHNNKLKFTLYGNIHGKQLPMFGNKGIICNECKFSMWGKERPVTWTQITATINPGDTSFDVLDNTFDWVAGQRIVVASTDFDHHNAEERIIASVSGTTVTVTEAFKNKHSGQIQTYGTNKLDMRAEVGLLTRNIQMMGDQTSVAGQYGSHLMMVGSSENGMVSHVGYSEFTHCGQPQITGRYCIHFHMNGDVAESEVTGNAVHHSFARVLTIHAIHFLRVKDNVGYLVRGHNFFIEDGIQTHNILDHNLAISSLQAFNMMQTDTSVASFWVTNPLNDLINNHAAGGDFYAFWYEIKPHPDGPSATTDICPEGMPLGASHDNVAHSYIRFGLRIFKLSPRQKPCSPIRNDELDDPWSENPSLQSRFYNYLTYKIGQSGLLAEETGNMIFENFTIAESGMAGMEFYRTNLTKEPIIARDMAIIGISATNPSSDSSVYNGVRGVIGPRTNGWQMQNIRFHNFNSQMTVLQACSKCDNSLLYTNRALEYFIQNIQFDNITGKYLFSRGLKRTMIYDTDGTFSSAFDGTTRTSATIVPKYPHLAEQTACVDGTTPTDWDNSLVCDDTVTVRPITITNAMPHGEFKNMVMKVKKLGSLSESIGETPTQVTQFKSLFGSMEPKDKAFAWSIPYITGSIYNVWWGTELQFDHIAIELSENYANADKAVIFKFIYSEKKELFQIGDLVHKQILGQFRTVSTAPLDVNTCGLGDYDYPDLNETELLPEGAIKQLVVCLSSRNKASARQYLDINAIGCRETCPKNGGDVVKEDKIRLWSNATQWPNEVLPAKGDNVSIPGEWTIEMDMQPEEIAFFEINGTVLIPQDSDLHIVAEHIWIRTGSIEAGKPTEPHRGSLKIQIRGNKTDGGYHLTPDVGGTKLFVVHGNLSLYGSPPATTWTKMAAYAKANDTQITVLQSSGWVVGDQLVIAPSFSSSSQHELVTITAISSNVITFEPALNYDHYGAAGVTIDNSYGQLDTRTAIGHLTRSIKIISGEDTEWGFKIITNSWLDGEVPRYGLLTLDGVEFDEGGQYDTENAALKLQRASNQIGQTIKNSAFRNCKSFCLDVEDSENIHIENNVFYLARLGHVRALGHKSYTFTKNLMIAAVKRPTVSAKDLIACYQSHEEVVSTVQVTNNVCQGSDLHGFAIAFSNCEDAYYPYSGNTASSAPACFIFNGISAACKTAKNVRAFACGIGQISSPPGTQQIQFENFMVADSGRAVTLRFGKQGDDRSAFFKNSYITAISRPDCTDCYGDSTIDCKNNHAVRMLAVTVNGESMPDKFGTGFDVICKQQTFDAKAFLTNVEFANYKLSYADLPQCTNNTVFIPHKGAFDMVASHNLVDCKCQNCQLSAMASFTPPEPKNFGWQGGCGDMLCTGRNNYLINDHTGSFLPQKGVLIANHSEIGDNTEGCEFISQMNGHYCTRQDFGVIEYESKAHDFNTRIMWPVYLKYEGGTWNSTTNGWRQWEWEGNQPLNKRLGRFVSVVQLYKTYNMTFQSEPPHKLKLQFQKRQPEGNNEEYIIIKMKHFRPNSIRVQNKGVTIKPIALRDNEDQMQKLDPASCGSNIFFFQNYTVHFVLTASNDCQLMVALTNSVQLTARFDMSVDDFYNKGGQTQFINRICAALDITDYSRVKIVGVYTGSVVVHSYIESKDVNDDSSQVSDDEQDNQAKSIQEKLNEMMRTGELQEEFKDFGTLQDLDSQIFDLDPITVPDDTEKTPEEEEEEETKEYIQNNLGLIIGVIVGGVTVIAAIFSVIIYMIRKRAKIIEISQIESDKVHMDSNGLQVEDMNSIEQFSSKE